MADEIVINGVGRGLGSEVDEYGNESRVVELIQKVKSLELEKAELACGNDEARERNHELMVEIERLKGEEEDMRGKLERMRLEIELAEDGKRVMDSIMKRAADLETEVVRLQHDWISATHEVEEVNRDAVELRRVVEEKEKRIEGLEVEVEALRNRKADSEMKVRDFERDVGVSLAREVELKSEKVRAETELQEKIREKEGLVSAYEKKVDTMEGEVGKIRAELEKVKKDKSVLEDALKESEEKVKKLEQKMIELQRELEVAESVVGALMEKAGKAVNGKREIADAVDGKCLIGLKDHWHMVAVGSAGAIAVAAVMVHVYFAKRQS